MLRNQLKTLLRAKLLQNSTFKLDQAIFPLLTESFADKFSAWKRSWSSKDRSGLPKVPQNSAEPLGFWRTVLREVSHSKSRLMKSSAGPKRFCRTLGARPSFSDPASSYPKVTVFASQSFASLVTWILFWPHSLLTRFKPLRLRALFAAACLLCSFVFVFVGSVWFLSFRKVWGVVGPNII